MEFRRLRTKIILSFCLLMIAGGTLTTLVVRYSLSQSLMVATRERGHVVADIMAHQLEETVRRGDWATAQLLVDTESNHNAFVLLEVPGGRIIGSTAGGEPLPAGALEVVGRSGSSQVALPSGEALDVPAAIAGGTLGTVHVGVSLEPVQATTRTVVRELLATTAAAMLAGILGIIYISGLISRPIARLSEAARRMGEGDLDARAPVAGKDELADLARTFNEMAGELRHRIGASEELRKYFERILDHLTKAVMVCHREGMIEYANLAAKNLFGARAGQRTEELFGEEAVLGSLPDSAALESGQVVHRTAILANGRAFAVSIGAIPPRNGVQSLVVSLAEVTEMQRLAERLRRAERVAAAGELAAGTVHAINNPLDGVRRALELARKHQSDPDRVQQLLAMAHEGTDRIVQITRGLLTFARADETSAALLVSPRAILEEAAQLVSLRAEQSGVAIRVEADPATPTLCIDPRGLVDVLVNLLANALDVSPAGGEIVAASKPGPEGGALLEVSDDGPGLPEDVRARMFEPFFTTKGAGRGTGLGLSMARRIVEAFGGEISASQRPQGGTTFAVWLPRASEGCAADVQQEASSCLDAS